MIFYKKSGAVLTDTPFFLALTEGVENYCQHTGYSLNIKYVYDTENVQQKLEDFIYAGAVGFILLGTEMMVEDLRPFAFLDIPIILLDNHFRSTKMDCVQINNVDGAFTATNYLINKKEPSRAICTLLIPLRTSKNAPTDSIKRLNTMGCPAPSQLYTH